MTPTIHIFTLSAALLASGCLFGDSDAADGNVVAAIVDGRLEVSAAGTLDEVSCLPAEACREIALDGARATATPEHAAFEVFVRFTAGEQGFSRTLHVEQEIPDVRLTMRQDSFEVDAVLGGTPFAVCLRTPYAVQAPHVPGSVLVVEQEGLLLPTLPSATDETCVAVTSERPGVVTARVQWLDRVLAYGSAQVVTPDEVRRAEVFAPHWNAGSCVTDRELEAAGAPAECITFLVAGQTDAGLYALLPSRYVTLRAAIETRAIGAVDAVTHEFGFALEATLAEQLDARIHVEVGALRCDASWRTPADDGFARTYCE